MNKKKLILMSLTLGLMTMGMANAQTSTFPEQVKIGEKATGTITLTVKTVSAEYPALPYGGTLTYDKIPTFTMADNYGGQTNFIVKIECDKFADGSCKQITAVGDVSAGWTNRKKYGDAKFTSDNSMFLMYLNPWAQTPTVGFVPSPHDSWVKAEDEVTFTLTVYAYPSTSKAPEGLVASAVKIENKKIAASEFEGLADDAVVAFTYTVSGDDEKISGIPGWGIADILDYAGSQVGINITVPSQKDEASGTWTNTVYYTMAELKHFINIGETKGLSLNEYSQSSGAVTVAFDKVEVYKAAATALPAGVEQSAEVVSTTYYSLTGVASQEPTKGVNIVKQLMSDGTTRVSKIVK